MVQISVITPVYNGENTIRETIASVLDQTFADFELIVIDDGSTDGTLEAIASFDDPRIRVFSYANAGQGKSRNRGIELAEGNSIAFIDADDLWTPDKLEAQWQALQANSEAAVAYSWTDHIDENGQFLRPGPHLSFNGDVWEPLVLADFIGSGSNPLIRTEALKQVGGFEPSLPPAEDWDLWLRLAKRYPFAVVPRVQILYRVASHTTSFNIWRMEKSSLRVIDRAFAGISDRDRLKRCSLANRYKYLTYKALDKSIGRPQAATAAKFLWLAIRYDPVLLRRRVIWKAALKIAIALIFPSKSAMALQQKLARMADLEALLVHMKTQPY
jgi:glycosyltransferase involved in cell wall biosynthesis